MSPPNARTNLPFASNFRTGGSVDLEQSFAAQICALVGYLEVNPEGGGPYQLSAFYEREAEGLDGFVFAEAQDDRQLWPALKKFFAKEGVEAAVR